VGNTSKIILATTVIFAAGVVAGRLLTVYSSGPKKEAPPEHAVPLWPQPQRMTRQPIDDLDRDLNRQLTEFVVMAGRELNLTPQQHERIGQIVREAQERTRDVWSKVAPELRREMQGVQEQISAELTPDQRARFEELLKQRERRSQEFRSGPPFRGGPRGDGSRSPRFWPEEKPQSGGP
jgi:Spy/CpxP family protein refolding chaperone